MHTITTGRALAAIALGLALLVPEMAKASCGAAVCAVNTTWEAKGVSTEPGFGVDLRYEYLLQDKIQNGTRVVEIGQIQREHDEVKTVNQVLQGTLDYTFTEQWGGSVTVPVIERYHKHIDNDAGETQTWNFTELGDTRVMGRYVPVKQDDFGHGGSATLGLNFGLKLPTGRYDMKNSQGQAAERTLQPGTGTTDAVVGGFVHKTISDWKSSLFAQTLWQTAFDAASEFKPGERVTLDLGYRYSLSTSLGLLLQINAVYRDRDQGEQADVPDSGGRFVYVSPGLSYAIGRDWQAYGFWQQPVLQDVNGVQLVVTQAYMAGMSARF